MKTVDYYFDFKSPYAYLALSQMPRLVNRWRGKANFVGHAINLWEARLAAGNNGPSNRTISRKGKALMQDVGRWAKRYGVPFRGPKNLAVEGDLLNRCFVIVAREKLEVPFTVAAFRKTWGEGGDMVDLDLIKAAAKEAGLKISGDDLIREAESPAALEAYKKENDAAQEAGVFGAPIFIVDDNIYWGNDRIEWVEEYLVEHTEKALAAAR